MTTTKHTKTPVINLPTRAPATGRPISIDEENRSLGIVVTTSARDRQGDVILPGGLDFANFLVNPVVLWAHDNNRPPVGKVTRLTRSADSVTARVQFADTDFAREVFTLYRDGFLSAWSIGFIPKKWERIDPNGAEKGFRVLAAEVVEVSAVPVPANPEALTRELANLKSFTLREELESAISAPTGHPVIQNKTDEPDARPLHEKTLSEPRADSESDLPPLSCAQAKIAFSEMIGHLSKAAIASQIHKARGSL